MRNKGNSTTIAIVIILVVLVVGAIYFAKNQESADINNTDQAVENEIPSDSSLSQTEAGLQAQGTSDDVDAIDADLKATSFETL